MAFSAIICLEHGVFTDTLTVLTDTLTVFSDTLTDTESVCSLESPNLSLTSIVIWTVWLLEEGPAGKTNDGEEDSSEKVHKGVHSCLSPEFIHPSCRIIMLYAYIPDKSTLGQHQPCGTR